MKLKGFTILEVILLLAISGLVLGIGVTGYFMAKGNFERYRTKTKALSEINLFHYILKRDVAQAISVTGVSNQLVLENGVSTAVEYNFKANYVLRVLPQRTDTFVISITNLNFEKLKGSKFVTGIQFQTSIADNKLLFYQTKSYAADVLIQGDKHGN